MSESGGAGRLIVICGLPGSGKTTLAKKIETRLGAIRFCPDEWLTDLSLGMYDEPRRAKIEALQWKLAQALLKSGLTVIMEWGTWGRWERDTLRLGARELGAAAELHFLTAPVDELYARIERRAMKHPSIQKEDVIRWAASFETPTLEEMALFDPPLFVPPLFIPSLFVPPPDDSADYSS